MDSQFLNGYCLATVYILISACHFTKGASREIYETRRFDRVVSTAARSRFPILISLSTKPNDVSIGGRSDREISETRRFDRVILTAARSRFPILISLSTKTNGCRSDREIYETRRFDRLVLTAARSRFPVRISLPPEFLDGSGPARIS